MLGTFLIIALILLIIYTIKRLKMHYNYWQHKGIPCENPHWVFGTMNGVVTQRTFFQMWQNYYRTFKGSGPFAGFYWFFKRAVFVMDPVLIKHILIKDFDKFSDRGLFNNENDDPLSAHLFTMEGVRWRNLRNKLSPTFTSGKMKSMFPIVVEVTEQMLSVLNEELAAERQVDIHNLAGRYTTDVIGRCAFGIECNSLRYPKQKFYTMSKRAFLENNLGPYGVAFRSSFPKLAKRLHMKDTVKEIEDFFLGTVRENVRYREENNVIRSDFMNLLLDLKNNRIIKNENGDDNTNLTFNEIAAQAFIFLVAGSETSSNTLTFALYEMAVQPNLQQKAREEIETILKDHNQKLTYEAMSEMKYVKQIVEETLRLHSPLPVLNRQASVDYVVPGHPKYQIKKDMPIIIPSICIHRDEEYYPNPDVFNPDNFSPLKVAERDSILYLPFGDGPRNCIGLRFAKMEIRIALVLMLKTYQFSVCDETPVPMKYSKENFMLTPEKELYLKISNI